MFPDTQKRSPAGPPKGGDAAGSVSVLLAESDPEIRDGLKRLLHRDCVDVIGEASEVWEAVCLVRDLRPHVAVLDLALPFPNTLEAVRQMQAVSPRTRVILLGRHREHPYVVAALGARIAGYVLRTRAAAHLSQAVRDVGRGRIHLCPDVIAPVLCRWRCEAVFSPYRLPLMERNILGLLLQGTADPEICRLLSATPENVALCRARILRRVARYACSRNPALPVAPLNTPFQKIADEWETGR